MITLFGYVCITDACIAHPCRIALHAWRQRWGAERPAHARQKLLGRACCTAYPSHVHDTLATAGVMAEPLAHVPVEEPRAEVAEPAAAEPQAQVAPADEAREQAPAEETPEMKEVDKEWREGEAIW